MKHLRLLPCLALAACGVYDLVGLPPNLPPQFGAYLFAVDTGTMELRLSATFVRGTDGAGQLMSLSEPAIIVHGERVRADSGTAIAARAFGFFWRSAQFPAATPLALPLDLPPLADAPATAFTIMLPLLKREGSDTLTLPATGDLQLMLPPAPRAGNLVAHRANWFVGVGGACGDYSQDWVLEVRGRGPPPGSITLPRAAFDPGASSNALICYRHDATYMMPSAPYEVMVSVASMLQWRVVR